MKINLTIPNSWMYVKVDRFWSIKASLVAILMYQGIKVLLNVNNNLEQHQSYYKLFVFNTKEASII